jgi:hypothetical protein
MRYKMRNILILTITIIGTTILLAISSKVSAATYYVADDIGDDSRTTVQAQVPTTPWKTIQKAADNMVAGDITNVKGGLTYNTIGAAACGPSTDVSVVCITTNPGSAGNPITYQAWPGTGIPIVLVSNTIETGFYVDDLDYITISGFDFQINVPGSALYIKGITDYASDNTIVKNNIFTIILS